MFNLHTGKDESTSGVVQLIDFFVHIFESGKRILALAEQNDALNFLFFIIPQYLAILVLENSTVGISLWTAETDAAQSRLVADHHSLRANFLYVPQRSAID